MKRIEKIAPIRWLMRIENEAFAIFWEVALLVGIGIFVGAEYHARGFGGIAVLLIFCALGMIIGYIMGRRSA